jgi:hypothetical protein
MTATADETGADTGLKAEEAPAVSERMTFSGHAPETVVNIDDVYEDCRLISERKLDLDHDAATNILQLPEFIVNDAEVDRNLRDRHVEYLSACMNGGRFHPEWVSIITCVCKARVGANPPGSEFRMNGQHTCWARLHVDADYRCPVKHLRYEAESIDAMRRLYASIDRNAPRTTGNVINSYLAGTDGFEKANKRILGFLSSGMVFWLAPQEDGEEQKVKSSKWRTIDPDTLAYLMRTKYREIVTRVLDFLTDGRLTHTAIRIVGRSPVIAAMYETMTKLKSSASHEFWEKVMDGIGLESTTDPRYKLREALMSATIGQGNGKAKGVKSVSQEDMYRWCITCWNYWRRDEPMKVLKGEGKSTGARPKAR